MGFKVVSQIHDEVMIEVDSKNDFGAIKQALNYAMQSQAAQISTSKLTSLFGKVDRVLPGQIRLNINNGNPVEILREHWVMGDWEVPSYMTLIVRDLVLDKEYELKPRRIGREIAEMEALAWIVSLR